MCKSLEVLVIDRNWRTLYDKNSMEENRIYGVEERDEAPQGVTINVSNHFLTCLRSVAFLIFSSNSSFVSFFFFFRRSSFGS
jgi:hypothetical protein